MLVICTSDLSTGMLPFPLSCAFMRVASDVSLHGEIDWESYWEIQCVLYSRQYTAAWMWTFFCHTWGRLMSKNKRKDVILWWECRYWSTVSLCFKTAFAVWGCSKVDIHSKIRKIELLIPKMLNSQKRGKERKEKKKNKRKGKVDHPPWDNKVRETCNVHILRKTC